MFVGNSPQLLRVQLVELALTKLHEGASSLLVALHALVILPVVLNVLEQIDVARVLDHVLHRLVRLLRHLLLLPRILNFGDGACGP